MTYDKIGCSHNHCLLLSPPKRKPHFLVRTPRKPCLSHRLCVLKDPCTLLWSLLHPLQSRRRNKCPHMNTRLKRMRIIRYTGKWNCCLMNSRHFLGLRGLCRTWVVSLILGCCGECLRKHWRLPGEGFPILAAGNQYLKTGKKNKKRSIFSHTM